MTKEYDTEELIRKYLDNGGTITKLRCATKRDVEKASRKWYHKDKASCGSDRSKKILEEESQKEGLMIFSKTERWKS